MMEQVEVSLAFCEQWQNGTLTLQVNQVRSYCVELNRRGSFAKDLRAKEAVDILNTATGDTSIYSNVSIQRFTRDGQALSLNGLLQANTNFELYGRVLVGLPPNTVFL